MIYEVALRCFRANVPRPFLGIVDADDPIQNLDPIQKLSCGLAALAEALDTEFAQLNERLAGVEQALDLT